MMLGCISEANLWGGDFYRSHHDWCVRLKASFDTVRRSQRRLKELGWIHVSPGYRQGRGRRVATMYKVLVGPEPGEHWTQMPRYMFDELLYRFGPETVLVYVYLT